MSSFDVLIVGAGRAGAHTAASLRQAGFASRIAIVSDAPEFPFVQRVSFRPNAISADSHSILN
jgi:2-polyprenyl-6-methoxyphenol hydroxylase-like FAD-dependent oxidoreductase